MPTVTEKIHQKTQRNFGNLQRALYRVGNGHV